MPPPVNACPVITPAVLSTTAPDTPEYMAVVSRSGTSGAATTGRGGDDTVDTTGTCSPCRRCRRTITTARSAARTTATATPAAFPITCTVDTADDVAACGVEIGAGSGALAGP